MRKNNEIGERGSDWTHPEGINTEHSNTAHIIWLWAMKYVLNELNLMGS
jgi:hypothetical protein